MDHIICYYDTKFLIEKKRRMPYFFLYVSIKAFYCLKIALNNIEKEKEEIKKFKITTLTHICFVNVILYFYILHTHKIIW